MGPQSNRWWQKSVRRLAGLRPFSWLFARILHHLDRVALRLTGGRRTAASLFTGLPVITLTTTGAKSGQPRSVPLVGIPDGEKLILLASNFGQHHFPAWYHNLRAHPEVMVTANGRTAPYVAREVEGAEREVCWQLALSYYPGYEAYKRRAGRRIPVIVLEQLSRRPDK